MDPSTVLLSLINNLVRPDVMGCPEPLIDQAVRSAARFFCRRTRAWRHDYDPIAPVAGQAEYTLVFPAGVEKVVVLTAYQNSLPLFPLTEYPQGSSTANTSSHYTESGINKVKVYAIPNASATATINLTVALTPTIDGTVIGADVYGTWGEGIAAGAASTLLKSNGKPWYNPGLAVEKEREFDSAMTRAVSDILRGNANRSISFTPRSFV